MIESKVYIPFKVGLTACWLNLRLFELCLDFLCLPSILWFRTRQVSFDNYCGVTGQTYRPSSIQASSASPEVSACGVA